MIWQLSKRYGIYLAWLLSLIGTFLSLYISEVKGITPCTICWYQRLCLFPLTLILGYASYHHFPPVIPYILSLPIAGGLISLYHSILIFSKIDSPCGGSAPCSAPAKMVLTSPYTMPAASLILFILITFFLVIAQRKIAIDD